MVGIGLVVFGPVIAWNLAHGGVSLKHVLEHAEVQRGLGRLSLGTFGQFVGSQALAFSPLLFGWMLVAMVAGLRQNVRDRDDRWLFLVWSWAPTFAIFLLLSLRQKVEANWAAPAYVAALIGAAARMSERPWPVSAAPHRRVRPLAICLTGIVALAMAVACHGPGLFVRLGFSGAADPMGRFKGWRSLGTVVGAWAAEMPLSPFLLSDRYQISSELAFYTPGQPRAYAVNLGRRLNQYDLWGGLAELAGRSAIYVQPDAPDLPLAFKSAFQECARGEPFVIHQHGREFKRWYLFRCAGFSGAVRQLPTPPEMVASLPSG